MKKIDTFPISITKKEYWQGAIAELYNTRKLCTAALLIALSIVLQKISLIIVPGLKVQITFIVASLSGVLLGPVLNALRGAVADLLGYVIAPEGAFYIGYTVQSAFAAFLYSLFFYRKKITFPRVILGKGAISLFSNAIFGSTLKVIYYTEVRTFVAFLLAFTASLAKQILLFPAEVVIILLVFNSLLPALQVMKLAYYPEKVIFNKKTIISLVIISVWVLIGILFFAFAPEELKTSINDAVKSATASIKAFLNGIFGIE